MAAVMNETIKLDKEGLSAVREEAAREFIGVSAQEFIERFRNGDYDGDNRPDLLMEALAFFPELD